MNRRDILRATAAAASLVSSASAIAHDNNFQPSSAADVQRALDALHRAKIRLADNSLFRFGDHRGSAVLISFWAYWCGRCFAEFPSMAFVQNAVGGQSQLYILAVSQPQNWEKDQAAAASHSVPFPLAKVELNTPGALRDGADMVFGDVDGTIVHSGMPVSFLFNRGGFSVKTVSGGADWASKQFLPDFASALMPLRG